jgi:hypothetical protein
MQGFLGALHLHSFASAFTPFAALPITRLRAQANAAEQLSPLRGPGD